MSRGVHDRGQRIQLYQVLPEEGAGVGDAVWTNFVKDRKILKF